MTALSAEQLSDIRKDIGDNGTVFTDDELHRLYTRADGDYDATVVLALRQIVANAAKLHDYRIAQSSESVSQVFSHLMTLLAYWENRVRGVASQVKVVGLRGVPPRDKDEPYA